MSDELLSKAAKALREKHDGRRAGAGFTRARVMGTLHHRRRRRLMGWLTLGPLGALLLGGSAWAEVTGRWPLVWHHLSGVFVVSQAQLQERALAERSVEQPQPSIPAARPFPSTPVDAGSAEEVPQSEADAGAGVQPKAATSPARSLRRTPRPSASVEVEPPVPEEPESVPLEARDPELAAFRRAHDAHFKSGDPAGALRAYLQYVERYPAGRFVAEARYNSALNYLRLGRFKDARRALRPFAAGQLGAHRQEMARQLLKELEAR